jgi:2-oxoglutarate dehydrogenase E2 component (dihydrolipoamide succinyltransferase)
VDVTNVVNWRNKVKDSFLKREGQKITYTPIFFEAAAKALKEYPQVNASVDGYNMVLRKNINIGMATALPSGNLIVPVIKNADEKNLLGITKDVNDLADRARNNKLEPDEIQGGTFTITNFGSFDSLTGTPIINQPQVAILAVGAIRKQPAVLETEMGDVIAIRQIMILSLAYDHRIVDGAMAGMFLRRMKELLEDFDPKREV